MQPDAELSQSPCEGVIPYSTYDVIVQMSGYQSQLILGVQIFAGVEALQQVEMVPTQERQPQVLVSQIPVHNLAGPPQPNLTEYSTALHSRPGSHSPVCHGSFGKAQRFGCQRDSKLSQLY